MQLHDIQAIYLYFALAESDYDAFYLQTMFFQLPQYLYTSM